MTFWNKICGFVIIFFLFPYLLTAQEHKLSNISFRKAAVTKGLIYASSISSLNKLNSSLSTNQSINLLPANYYTQHFGIMCKQELAIEKVTKIQLRFRLGSLQQCNYLEGKK